MTSLNVSTKSVKMLDDMQGASLEVLSLALSTKPVVIQNHADPNVKTVFLSFLNGSEYSGHLRNNRMHGLGRMVWGNGLVYEGDWRDNAATGHGVLTWPNHARYCGEVHNGKRHGYGVFTTGAYTYSGEWRNGRKHGVGSLHHESDYSYIGEWENGKREGWGGAVFPDGNRYHGQWAGDARQGYGTMVWVSLPEYNTSADLIKTTDSASTVREAVRNARSKSQCVGTVSPGPLGPYTPAIPTNTDVMERYTGDWLDGHPHGEGVYEWIPLAPASGASVGHEGSNVYSGHFERGQRCGHGTHYYTDGSVYEGMWSANLKHGAGKIFHPDGAADSVVMDRDVPKTNVTRFRQGATTPTTTLKPAVDKAKPDGAPEKKREKEKEEEKVDSHFDISDLGEEGPTISAQEMSAVNGVVTRYKNMLRHLYEIYAAADRPVDLQRATMEAPTPIPPPNCARRTDEDLMSRVTCGMTPAQRNTSIIDQAAKSANSRALAAGKAGLHNAHQCERDARDTALVVETENIPRASALGYRSATPGGRPGSGRQSSNGGTRSAPDPTPGHTPGHTPSPFPHPVSAATTEAFDDIPVPDLEELPPPAPLPIRKSAQHVLKLWQLMLMLYDAQVVGGYLTANEVADCLRLPLVRQKYSTDGTLYQPSDALPPGQDIRLYDGSNEVLFTVFIEVMIRLANLKLTHTFPFFAVSAKHRLRIADRVEYFMTAFLEPLDLTLRDLDGTAPFLASSVPRYIKEAATNGTLDEYRRTALRFVRERARDRAHRIQRGLNPDRPQQMSNASMAAPPPGSSPKHSAEQPKASESNMTLTVPSSGDVLLSPNSNAGLERPGSASSRMSESVAFENFDSLEAMGLTVNITPQDSDTLVAKAQRRGLTCVMEVCPVTVSKDIGHANQAPVDRTHDVVVFKTGAVSTLAGIITHAAKEKMARLDEHSWHTSTVPLPPSILLRFLPVAEAFEVHGTAVKHIFNDLRGASNTVSVQDFLYLMLDVGVFPHPEAPRSPRSPRSNRTPRPLKSRESSGVSANAKKIDRRGTCSFSDDAPLPSPRSAATDVNGELDPKLKSPLLYVLNYVLLFDPTAPATVSIEDPDPIIAAPDMAFFRYISHANSDFAAAVHLLEQSGRHHKTLTSAFAAAGQPPQQGEKYWWLVANKLRLTLPQVMESLAVLAFLCFPITSHGNPTGEEIVGSVWKMLEGLSAYATTNYGEYGARKVYRPVGPVVDVAAPCPARFPEKLQRHTAIQRRQTENDLKKRKSKK